MKQTTDLIPYPWQQQQWQYLAARAVAEQLPHALLLVGPQGLGKFQFAYAFAQLMLCHTAPRFEKACGHCAACHWLAANTHPDLMIIDESESSKIKVDSIRELLSWQNQSSHQGSYKIALITPAHAMNKSAANAILKTLEEPAANTLIILVSDQPSLLPATIRSRCQMIKFSSEGHQCAKIAMLQQQAVDSDPGLLLQLTDGAPLRALQLAQSEQLAQRQQLLSQLLDGQLDPITLAAQCNHLELTDLLQWLVDCLVDLIRVKVASHYPGLMNQDFVTHIKSLANQMSVKSLYALLDRLYQVQLQHKHGINFNRQLLIESLLCQWFAL